MTTPARLLFSYIPPDTVNLQVREMNGKSAYMADYPFLLRLLDADCIEGVGPRSGRIRYVRLTVPLGDVSRKLAEREAEKQAQVQAQRAATRPSPESRFSLKFTYREQVGDARIVVLKRVDEHGHYATWRKCGFNPKRFNPDAVPEPLRRY
ncbi:MAG TPA: hypothetical protein VN428_02270 [Bryobacteraceae bacterium]|nr:hypothetical protein [Bryobacteraceae bacterium]